MLHGSAEENLNMRGAMLEVVSDLVGSVGAIVAALTIMLTGWQQADAVVSVLIGLFIVPRAYGLLKSGLDVLLEAAPPDLDLKEVVATMQRVPGVMEIHDIHAWTIASGYVAMSAHTSRRAVAPQQTSCTISSRSCGASSRASITSRSRSKAPGHVDDGACCVVDPRCLPLVR